jgi:predicted RNA-binding Zn-ribbon protein involved in translation (DUF1610 family)
MNYAKIVQGSSVYRNAHHFCPKCRYEFVIRTVRKLVDPKSPEAVNYDFSLPVEGRMIGQVLFTTEEFCCPNCGNIMTIRDMSQYEREHGIQARGIAQAPVDHYVNKPKFFLEYIKRRKCTKCGKRMFVNYRGTLVHSESPEAKDYDFSFAGAGFSGYVDFQTAYWQCPKCRHEEALDISKAKE